MEHNDGTSAISKSDIEGSSILSEPEAINAQHNVHEATKELILEVEFSEQTVHVMKDDPPVSKKNNVISTTKFTWYTWLPKSLFQQFRRVANAYFLLISILMLIGTYAPQIYQSPLDPYSTVGTLIFVLLVTSIKELMEDLQRGKSDRYENNRVYKVITFDENNAPIETLTQSWNIRPGDIVKLEGTVPSPVDLLLILTSIFDDGNKCYIETANIDGETNLKVREAPPSLIDTTGGLINEGVPVPKLFQGRLNFEPPNKNIHNFVGTLKLDAFTDAVPLGPENLVLRSALFSNTDWCYGIAVYTGQETKIQMNNRLAPSKMSKIEENLNKAIIIIFISQCILVTISVVSIWFMGFEKNSKLPYVFPPGEEDTSVLPLWLESWIVFFLLYNNFIPISLYVSIEIVNVGQAWLIANDIQLYREQLDTPCGVRSSNLVQELGMVSNVFSDKTGTLTRNEMNLVKFVINGQIYDIQENLDINADIDTLKADQGPQGAASYMNQFGNNKEDFYNFFRCLITCHTVVREKTGTYRAESPDELALVEGAGKYKCYLWERGSKEMHLGIFGERKVFEVLAVNPFNADRKRMSVLVRDSKTGIYWVMCKGADNIMLPLCKTTAAENESAVESLLELSNLGLRTLIIAHKQLDTATAEQWLDQYKKALLSTINREQNISIVSAKLELDMKLVGITAIEDRLQDEVPEVIHDMTTAGIIVWMLTGDKLETAINIGRSCNLLLPDTRLHKLSGIEDPATWEKRLEEEYKHITEHINPNSALVLDGPSFVHFDDKNLQQRKMLLVVGALSRSVIACRLTPTQKRELVKLVKTDTVPAATTLAIGDGANDVSMILEGNVGVGIYGKEGRQAANNADIAIGEFKFLRRLLLVHGRWNYIRQSKVFLYSMHKNMVLTLTLFWFSYYTAVSGTSLYESWVYSGFNFILGLPILFYGILDRDISAEFALKHPQTYSTGRTNVALQVSAIFLWIINAILYATILCLMFYIAFAQSFQLLSLYEAGTYVFVAMCLALQLKVAFFHHQWAWPHILVMFISVFGMFIYLLLVGVNSWDYYYEAEVTFTQGAFWLFAVFFVPLMIIYIDVLEYYVRFFFLPTNEQLFREIEHANKFDEVDMLTCADKSRKPKHQVHSYTNQEDIDQIQSGSFVSTFNPNKNANLVSVRIR